MPRRSSSLAAALAAAALASAPAARAAEPDPSYLPQLLARARAEGLAAERAWLRLGHYRPRALGGWESEADGPAFFLAKDGAHDPAAELEATLRGFFAPEPVEPKDATADHPQCRFPARLGWLAERLAIDRDRLPPRACPRFDAFARRLAPRSAAMIFSSYYLNNPASAFGHTFLRLGKEEAGAAGERLDLVDQGVDFAAIADTNNGLLYAAKGLTGLFRGEFTARPYFYKVREYADFESRDLWEYELALGPRELARLVGHLWELGQTWFDYYYLTENCSYHVLGALEAADPRLELLANVGPVTLPADAVKALFANAGLVRAVRFRPSGRTQLAARAEGLGGRELDAVTALADGADLARTLAPWPAAARVRLLDTALDLVDVRHGKDIVLGTDPAAERLRQRLLEGRSALGLPSPPLSIPPPATGGPERGHPSMRVGVGGGGSTADGPLVLLEGRLALHDFADPPAGFSGRAQLEFLKVRAVWAARPGSLRLDEALLVDAASLNVLDRFERRISWKMRAGLARVTDAGCRGCVAGRFEAGGGPAVVAGPLAAQLTADAELSGAPDLRGMGGHGVRPGVGPGALVRWLGGDRAVLLGTAGWRWLPLASPRTTWAAGLQGRLHLGSTSLAVEATRTPLGTEVLGLVQVYGR